MQIISILCVVFCVSCGVFDEDDGEGGGKVVANKSKIFSTSLSSLTANACSASATTCTPDNIQGRIFMAGALLGNSSNGSENYNMTFLADKIEIIERPDLPEHPEGTQTFNLNSPTVFSGLMSIPEDDSMPNPAVITRVETMFDYIDATFTVSGSSESTVNGTFTIRTVFRKTAAATDIAEGETMQWGDKMVKLDGETTFKWCDSQDCSHSIRPGSPLQQDSIINSIDLVGTEPGNPNYVGYAIDLQKQHTTSSEELNCETCLWSIDYDISSAISLSKTPSTLTSIKELVESFSLEYGCGFRNCQISANRITATLTIGEQGSAP